MNDVQAANAPDINIICEKVAFDGVTRFEDRYRLPLGVTVNITDYSAQMATEVPSGISSAYLLSLLLSLPAWSYAAKAITLSYTTTLPA